MGAFLSFVLYGAQNKPIEWRKLETIAKVFVYCPNEWCDGKAQTRLTMREASNCIFQFLVKFSNNGASGTSSLLEKAQ